MSILTPSIEAYIKAPGFKAKKASWSSEDQEAKVEKAKGVVYEDAIVRITNKGKLTAIGVGTTTLTATDGKTELKFTVKVAEPVVKELHMNVSAKKAFKLSGTKKQPEWAIADQAIASMAEKGKIAAIKAGVTVMTGKCENIEFTVRVTVEDPTIPGLSGKAPNYTISIKKGETMQLDLSGISQPIAFKSNKSYVAFINTEGKLYGRTKGSANITTKVNGKTIKIKVTVTE